MSGSTRLATPRQGLTTREAAFLLILAAGAWAATIRLSRGIAGMPGTMGLGLGLGLASFLAIWTLMMSAMMLPSVTPTASLYARTVVTNRPMRIAGLIAGYLGVWAVAGLPAYGLAWMVDWLADAHPGTARVLAVAVFATCGVYQLSRLKDRCLAHCRSPIALLLRYGSYRGRFRDVRAGAHHGAYCLGCCWGLMAVLIALGTMNIVAMAGLAAVVLAERVAKRGRSIGRLAGIAAIGLAVATIWLPWLAPGCAPPNQTMS
jgi:predicted metal-binding membrane protein